MIPKTFLLENNSNNNFEFSKTFRNDYLNLKDNPELLKQPVLITNILFRIMADLRDNMFHENDTYIYVPDDKIKNQKKLKLWEDEIINSDKNIIKKAYKTSTFLKNRNKDQITHALDFLKNYKNKQYTFVNAEGVKLTTSGGLIKDWYFLDKTGVFEITISLYWADKIVRLKNNDWNNFKLDVANEFNNIKQRFFLLWIMGVKKYNGTTKKWKDIQELYDLKYTSSYELRRGFLAPIKAKLDNNEMNNNWFSFNYYVDEKNNSNIRFVPYDVKPKKEIENTKLEIENKDADIHHKNLISYKIKYLKRQHNLSTENAIFFKLKYLSEDFALFESNYKEFKKVVKKEKKKVTEFIDVDFLNKYLEIHNKN